MTESSPDELQFYAKPGSMTELAAAPDFVHGLPRGVKALCEVVQGVLLHIFWAEREGIQLSKEREEEVNIRAVSERLARIRALSDRPLVVPRPPERRSVGNCRDFSTLLCALLRHQGVPARARCGFGTYFNPGWYEDHWICEYWDTQSARWAMVDSQLDALQRQALDIRFDPLDVPAEKFIVAGKAWQRCRSGQSNPDKFGIFDMRGLRFIWGDVVRDFLALNKVEILPWDGGWGFLNQRLSDPLPGKETLLLYDRIAAMTLEIDARFPEIRAYYESEPRFHMPSDNPGLP